MTLFIDQDWKQADWLKPSQQKKKKFKGESTMQIDRVFLNEVRAVGKMISSKNLSLIKRALEVLSELVQKAEVEVKEVKAAGAMSKAFGLDMANRVAYITDLCREAVKLAGIQAHMVPISAKGFLMSSVLVAQEMSFDEITGAIRNALIEEDPGYYYWFMDCYTDAVIYSREPRNSASGGDVQLFRRGYSILDGKVTFAEATEVERQVIYVEKKREGMTGKIRLK